MNAAICYINQELIKWTPNIFDETIYSIVVFKINVFFVLLKEQLPDKGTTENLDSFRSKVVYENQSFMRKIRTV